MGSLLRQDFQGLHNELLLRIGEHYQQVFNGLSILASFASSDDPYQGPRDITSPELMVRDIVHGISLFGFLLFCTLLIKLRKLLYFPNIGISLGFN